MGYCIEFNQHIKQYSIRPVKKGDSKWELDSEKV